MEIKYGESLEFEVEGGRQVGDTTSLSLEKEEALRQIIRHGYRAPVGVSQKMALTIGEDSYAIFNLSVRGVGIYLNESGQLESHPQPQKMTLVIGGQSFPVEGVIVHVSNDGAHNLCGIELTSMSPECQSAILDYLQKSKSALFSS